MRLIGNILWLIFGGLFMGICWFIAGIVAFLTIIGIPWGRACFVIGNFYLWPFGREIVSRKELTGKEDIGTGPLGMVGNVIWFLFGGWWLALGNLGWGLLCAITIIGIPFALQFFKLAWLSLAPIGKTVVTSEEARAARQADRNTGNGPF